MKKKVVAGVGASIVIAMIAAFNAFQGVEIPLEIMGPWETGFTIGGEKTRLLNNVPDETWPIESVEELAKQLDKLVYLTEKLAPHRKDYVEVVENYKQTILGYIAQRKREENGEAGSPD